MEQWARAGGAASANRVLVGGTVTREAFYSTARRLTREARGAFTDHAQEEELILRRARSGLICVAGVSGG